MFTFISDILNKLGEKAYLTLSIGIAIAIGTTPIAVTFLLMNSGGLSWKTANREIEFTGKARAASKKNDENLAKLQTQFDSLYKSYVELAEAQERNKPNRIIKNKIEKLDKEFVESGVRLDDVKESQKEVEELVERAIAQ